MQKEKNKGLNRPLFWMKRAGRVQPFPAKTCWAYTKKLTMLTKGFMKTNGVIALSLFALMLTSCDKDDDDTTGNTITDVVVRSDDFSLFESAVLKANVQTTLSGVGPFTVFAPNNAAFTASGVTTAVLNSLSADQTRTILLYHA